MGDTAGSVKQGRVGGRSPVHNIHQPTKRERLESAPPHRPAGLLPAILQSKLPRRLARSTNRMDRIRFTLTGLILSQHPQQSQSVSQSCVDLPVHAPRRRSPSLWRVKEECPVLRGPLQRSHHPRVNRTGTLISVVMREKTCDLEAVPSSSLVSSPHCTIDWAAAVPYL
eukprot:COSAG02_NODE_155_length_33066_cov_32.167562_22_plen_169_part_00